MCRPDREESELGDVVRLENRVGWVFLKRSARRGHRRGCFSLPPIQKGIPELVSQKAALPMRSKNKYPSALVHGLLGQSGGVFSPGIYREGGHQLVGILSSQGRNSGIAALIMNRKLAGIRGNEGLSDLETFHIGQMSFNGQGLIAFGS